MSVESRFEFNKALGAGPLPNGERLTRQQHDLSIIERNKNKNDTLVIQFNSQEAVLKKLDGTFVRRSL